MSTNRPDTNAEDARVESAPPAPVATARQAAPTPAPAAQSGQPATGAQDADRDEHADALTVVITPGGRTIECDDWSEANNLVTTGGCSVKAGYPRTREEAMVRAEQIAERRRAEQQATQDEQASA